MMSQLIKPTILAFVLLSTPAAGLLDSVTDELDCRLALEVTFTAYLGTITGRRDNDHSFLADKFVSFETIEQVPVYELISGEYQLVGYEETVEEHDLHAPVAFDVNWHEEYIKWRSSSFTVLLAPWAVFDLLDVSTVVPKRSCDDTPIYSGLNGFFRDHGPSDYHSPWQQDDGWYAVANSVEADIRLATPEERAALAEEDPYDVAYDISDADGYTIYVDLRDALNHFEPVEEELRAWWPTFSS